MTPELIQSPAHMDELVNCLANEKFIAADTEFFRETSYYPQLALVQFATDSILACVDPLAFDARAGLRKLFLNPGLIKIFHSCSQDMEVLFYYLGEIPVSIVDTQIANALLSEQHQISYALLVEKELGVQLDKSQTRTNWLQRPLTKKQIEYAGDDVFYLYQLYQLLDKKLYSTGRKKWFEEDCRRLFSGENSYQVETDKLWKRVKGTAKLNQNKLAIVQAIALWREHIAKQKNLTRRRVLADEIIVKIAMDPPEDICSLNQLIYRKYKLNDTERQQLFSCITPAMQSPAKNWPDNRYNVLDNRQKRLLKALQQIINDKATQLNVSTGILGSKKELESLILFYSSDEDSRDKTQLDNLAIVNGWRFHCFGQQLIDTIKNSE